MLLSKSPDDLLRWPGQTKQDTDALLAVLQTATQSLESEKILNDTLDRSLGILGIRKGY
jgi:hypothetical protein